MDTPNKPTKSNFDDCISREAVLDAFHHWFADGFEEDRWWNSTHVLAAIEGLPSVNPQPCEDAISRQAVMERIENEYRQWGEEYDVQQVLGDIEDMPSVTPSAEDIHREREQAYMQGYEDASGKYRDERPIGHWRNDGYYADYTNESVWRCSECDHHIIEYDMEGYKFCPNCGCRMVGDDNENSD